MPSRHAREITNEAREALSRDATDEQARRAVDEQLDEALREKFPASDAVSINRGPPSAEGSIRTQIHGTRVGSNCNRPSFCPRRNTEQSSMTNSNESKQPAGRPDTNAVGDVSDALNMLLADVFSLYVKTKSAHWHMSGRHFRDYHLMLDEQAEQLFGMVDPIAERCRKMGNSTIVSIDDIQRRQRLRDNGSGRAAQRALAELHADNVRIAGFLRDTHEICEKHRDVATASLLENWLDEAEGRVWFLREILRDHA